MAVQPAAAGVPCPTMLVTTTAVQATSSTRDVVSSDGTVVHVTRDPSLTFNDFTNANVTLTEGHFVLNIGLTPSSAKRWADFTAENVGRAVAFIVGDKVVRKPTIKDPITGSSFLIGPFSRAEGQKLAGSINNKCVKD
ncbi:MAG: preprotein translocase subunit SecD [Bryobacterales bacterium]|nr:preprotein translocase subunit SecD [Bryobacterales bacterium]